jgi:hypothetical protein
LIATPSRLLCAVQAADCVAEPLPGSTEFPGMDFNLTRTGITAEVLQQRI